MNIILMIKNLSKIYNKEILVTIGASLFTIYSYCNSALRYASDDQFILYRYIDNIARGDGFVYNMGEKILGSTTPLFTLLLASIKYVFQIVNTPDLVAYVNITLFSLSAAFFYRLSSGFVSDRWALISATIYFLSSGRIIPQGMETSLFLLIFFVFLDFLLQKKFIYSSIFLSLLLLTRPDAGLIAILAFIYWWQKEGLRKTIKYTVVTIGISLPWLIFATLYFGSPIPQSVMAKLHVNDIINQSSFQAFKVQTSSISRIYWGNIFDPDNIPAQVAVNLLPVCFFVLVWIKKRMNKDNWIILAISLAYLISYSISNPVMFPWYTSQLKPAWILISFAGAVVLISKTRQPWLLGLCTLILISGPAVRWYGLATNNNEGNKILGLFEIAGQIKPSLKSNEKVMVNNFGAIGYATGAYIIDPFGLINPDASRFYPILDKCVDKTLQFTYPPKMIEEMRPDWLLISKKELKNCFSDERIQSHYSPFYLDGKIISDIWRLKK